MNIDSFKMNISLIILQETIFRENVSHFMEYFEYMQISYQEPKMEENNSNKIWLQIKRVDEPLSESVNWVLYL